jgi:hypothetical protein
VCLDKTDLRKSARLVERHKILLDEEPDCLAEGGKLLVEESVVARECGVVDDAEAPEDFTSERGQGEVGRERECVCVCVCVCVG